MTITYVYLVAGEQVDDGFQLRDGTGIAAAVNHDAAPREARTVRDLSLIHI